MLNIKDPKDREKTIKSILNGKVVKSITVENLRDMENFEEIESFFKKVRDKNAEEIAEQSDALFFENEEEINYKLETYSDTIQL